MTENVLLQGIQFYKDKQYSDALAFFLALPADCGADKIEIAYYLGLCFAKLEKYEDALLYLEQVVTSGNTLEKVLPVMVFFYAPLLILYLLALIIGIVCSFEYASTMVADHTLIALC